ncbi:MAG: FAD-dependent oxidoreductase [Candidatus Eisenbacteria bacterium]
MSLPEPPGVPRYDFVIIGSGPAGQKAAVQAAKAGRRVLVIEQDRKVGGSAFIAAPFRARRSAKRR